MYAEDYERLEAMFVENFQQRQLIRSAIMHFEPVKEQHSLGMNDNELSSRIEELTKQRLEETQVKIRNPEPHNRMISPPVMRKKRGRPAKQTESFAKPIEQIAEDE